jgi:hypothetical protein
MKDSSASRGCNKFPELGESSKRWFEGKFEGKFERPLE